MAYVPILRIEAYLREEMLSSTLEMIPRCTEGRNEASDARAIGSRLSDVARHSKVWPMDVSVLVTRTRTISSGPWYAYQSPDDP